MKQTKLLIIDYSDSSANSNTIDVETLKSFNVQSSTIIKTITKYTESNLADFIKLLPFADLLICNLLELERLLKVRLNTHQEITQAAQNLLKWGAKSVLIKASQLKKDFFCQDYWSNQEESFWLATPRLPEQSMGKKAILSSAIAACLARHYALKDAIVIARMYVQRGLRKAYRENQTLKFFHSTWPEEHVDLPYLSTKPFLKWSSIFKSCRTGLYPIVDSSLCVEKLFTLGVKCIQLRIKNADKLFLEKEIKRSVFLAKKYQATLFINDYWKLAIHYGASGIHLGQEDLVTADIDEIYQSGLYLGVSTHCYYEVARAHANNPSYMACGPIYFTNSKEMSFQPQGIEQLECWRRTLSYPLVAIGGIKLECLPEILKAKVDGVAVISAITQAEDPSAAIKEFLRQINNLK